MEHPWVTMLPPIIFRKNIVHFISLEMFESEESQFTHVLAAVVSSVVAFLVILVLRFVVGFVCGHYFGRKSKQPSAETQGHPSASQPVPLYENVITSTEEHQEQEFELRENVAHKL